MSGSVRGTGSKSTHLYREVLRARQLADEKHGDHSIEQISSYSGRWLPILVEEIGEVATANLCQPRWRLREELIDVLAVASAWVDALDEIEEYKRP
jgi:NTP pyrophosphatase (non-canonical NTP hydrolase)